MAAIAFYARSITELVAKRARESPDTPAIYTGVPDSKELLQPLTYADVERAVHRLAWHYSSLGLQPTLSPGVTPPSQVIAVLVSTAIDETLLELAIATLGLTALLLSVNNSIPAIAHLIKKTKATHLIYGPKFEETSEEVRKLLGQDGYQVGLVEDKRFPLWGSDGIRTAGVKRFPLIISPEEEKDRIGVILHSSGSTGFPKPCYITHYGLIANAALNQNKPGFSTLPVFHGYGHFATFRCLYSGQPFTLFPPHLPLTCANICTVIDASPPIRQCFAVPYVIKLMGENSEGVGKLASFDTVSYAGAALPDDLGDRLTAAGVNLLSIYGLTETGSLMNSNRDFESDKAWNWVRPLPGSAPYLVFEERGEGTYEVVVRDGYPPKIETNRPDGSYATKDLFMRHPQNPEWYKYVGRLDDTLVQTLGEKTNPVPIELSIRGNSPYVQEAIVFGAARPQTGLLILPSPLAQSESLTREELMEKIWPVIEQANAEAPTHSRVLPEMVEFLPYDTEIPVATKMSILRPACYAKFKDLIDSIYDRFEAGAGTSKLPLSTPKPELEDFILDTIAKTLGPTKSVKLTKSVDLFEFGVDSLQGIRVRNALQGSVEMGGAVLGQNVIYEHPSVEKLADHILVLRSGADASKSDEQQHQVMIGLVEKWSARLETHSPQFSTSPQDGARIVVLTGATGSLGAHILAQLVASPIVKKVICLSRAKSHAESFERIRESLRLRKLAIGEEKIVSYGADTSVDGLGLTEEEYEGVKREVTDVIHNAWPVNFNLSIESYDPHIGGALHLLNLALRSPYSRPASFFFSSSISCRQGGSELECPEDWPSAPRQAAGTGYARSKWVVERICERAAQEKGVTVGVLRIGQMVGDTVHGVWNETEAWPLMFKSAQATGALPLLDEHPSWLPVDYAARAIAELVLRPTSSQPRSKVYHIVNPDRSASWRNILDALRESGVKFERTTVEEWLDKLAGSEKDVEMNPAIKLLPFFRARYGATGRKPMVFLTNETVQLAPSLRESPPMRREIVRKWVEHWREFGFLI
ncbi:acetyl-CoA synthetase-like protein [Neolentinus lepideus HHB14362 ss-1]|uniref:Acetyl-CoA synthetase-like protein n=1 Tax=Neolentinus lepideus HHB14362 ss-1 TaxID=1314782 RepID=A0A165N9X7_9AGAM|nr:acetyl-CoA synthetase-like protein [Neolentinus lepideus HHB14362 ss-1]